MSSDGYNRVLERLAIQASEKPHFIFTSPGLIETTPPKPKKERKRRLFGVEYDEVLANYWFDRPEKSHVRERFVEAAMDWVIYAFLHENADRGIGRNHEIVGAPDTDEFIALLDDSSDQMQRNLTCKVEMRSVCWWDVQEHYHNLRSKDINQLADDLMDPLIHEAIERLKAAGFLSWHSGVWNLSAEKSRGHILRLKQRGSIFLAPEPSKLSGTYAA